MSEESVDTVAHQGDMRAGLRRLAGELLEQRLTAGDREALLIKCWMSHDARWFTAVAAEFGQEVANRLNKVAAHQLGIAEARRLAAALGWPRVESLEQYLLFQETGIDLLGPELLDYEIRRIDDHTFHMPVNRCFAYENVTRAGIAEHYQCGILPRVTGWLVALGIDYQLDPPLGKCLKVQGKPCAYTVDLRLSV